MCKHDNPSHAPWSWSAQSEVLPWEAEGNTEASQLKENQKRGPSLAAIQTPPIFTS